MARRPYGGTTDAIVTGADYNPLAGRDEQGNVIVSGTAWTAATGGTQITDLQNLDGSPVADGVVVPDQNGRLARFLGPDDGRADLWLDFGFGRFLLLATDLPTRVGVLESGGIQPTGAQYPATCVVYSSTFRTSRPATDAGQFTWTCDGTADQTEINAAIAAAAAEPGGSVILLGSLFNITGSIQMRTGVALRGEGLGTVIRAASDFGAGMVTLLDNTTHVTHLSMLTLDGAFRNVSGVHYTANGGEVFTSTPASNPDPSHWIRDLHIISMGNTTYAGYGMRLTGGNLRAGKYSDIRILNASGCGFWADGMVDSHMTNIEIGSCGDTTLGYSATTTAPMGAGFFINQGDNNMFTACKSWFSKGPGYYIRGTRNGLSNCQSQDNDGHGFQLAFGKNMLNGCIADSNGAALGAGGGNGRSGFYAASDSVNIVGCQSFDRGRGWQQNGFEITSGLTRSRITGCVTYGNLGTSVLGTAGTGTTVDVAADANGK